jgi:hypothetical protein
MTAIRTGKWRKASGSSAEGECVEAARTGTGIALRDSKQPFGLWLTASPAGWRSLLADVRDGVYDLVNYR